MNFEDWSDAHLLTIAAKALQSQAAEYLKGLGLPRLGLYILEHLADRSPILQSELAGMVMARTQTIGPILSRLEHQQWVTRKHGLSHNQVSVAITDQGRNVLASTQKHLRTLQPSLDIDPLRPFLQAIIKHATHG